MMPAGTQHDVLCVTCRQAAFTVLAYPESCCAQTSWAKVSGRRLRVSCTLRKGTCVTGFHLDTCVLEARAVVFTSSIPALMRSREGKTGKA